MSIAEYIANLNRIKDQALANWSNMSATEKEVFEESFDWLVENLDIKRGTITVNDDLTNQMNQFVQVVVDLVNKSKGYESKLTGFVGDLDTIQKNNKKFHGSFNNFDIETAGVKNVQKAVVEEIINQYTDNGLNPNFAAPLRDGIFRNILAGANMKDIRQYLQVYILGGEDQSGKLNQYLNQTAQQAVDSYTGMINQQLNKDFKFTGYIISGSLIETSSTQCIYAVEHANDQGYLSFPDWNQVLDIARNNKKAKLIEGTTLVNLPINKLHWGCRHDFTPVIIKPKEEPKKATVKKPKAEPKPQPTAQQAQAQTFFREAKSKNEAKQVTKDMFENMSGFKVAGVTISNDLDTAQMNRINAKLNQLLNEYKTSQEAAGEQPVQITFRSVAATAYKSGSFGYVKPNHNYSLNEINFGHDYSREQRNANLAPEMAKFLEKSQVDPENVDLSTVVHEFGHVISLYQQGNYFQKQGSNTGEFWREMNKIQSDYNAELRRIKGLIDNPDYSDMTISPDQFVINRKKLEQEFADIYLGQYAEKNLNEFMAESFTNYKLSSTPSSFAKKVGLLIDKFFKK